MAVGRRFSRVLQLQTSLNHLCQTSRGVVSSAGITTQMLDDWQAIDRVTITKQIEFAIGRQHLATDLKRITICE